MSVVVTYTIAPFTGTTGSVTTVQPASAPTIDASGKLPGEATVTNTSGTTGITVSKGTVSLIIKILDNGRSSGTYYTTGLAVQPQSGGARAPTTVFPQAQVSAAGTSILLSDENTAPTATTSYEFVVLFQAANGNFGILDPLITNANA